ncbi:SpoIIE family protein phosphatase [Streptantibioticus silvisoli]|uniref:SpoIIE family protein phosphatase n=1 Tax=Streptantibioticus silvisoli TaxID=2705255 RepID=A0ABT6W183_9ACTN|nr:SpoIIE family protein phosphatase [Streptantibioticus silvisoli]MDI5964507.1 SpoIIE family protein phosphatase [Streptantibioticus silvisoli]
MTEQRASTGRRLGDREAARLRLVETVAGGLADGEVWSFAIDQAVAFLGGVGGMAHVGEGADGDLRLAAVCGLPRRLAEPWQELGAADAATPARAVRERRIVRTAAGARVDGGRRAGEGAEGDGENGEGEDGGRLPTGTALVAVPVTTTGSPLGVLTVLTSAAEPPDAASEDFLRRFADRIGDRLRRSRGTAETARPTWWQEPSGSQLLRAMRAIDVGAWEWEVGTGRLIADDAALEVFGLPREDFDDRVETWVGLIHPDDAAGVLAEVDRAIRHRNAYSLEYRICRPDGAVIWLEARGYLTFGAHDEVRRMSGTVWETTGTRQALDSVSRALRHMSDAFLAVDDQWRVVYCNVEAERVLGADGRLLGRVLWDAAPDTASFGLPERYEQAVARGTAVGFEVRAPGTGSWYHMRLVAVPGGLTVYFTDITARRAQAIEGARADHVRSERATRLAELTGALAQALTVEDVVRVTADGIVPLTGAADLRLLLVEEGLRPGDGGAEALAGRGGRFSTMSGTAPGPAGDALRDRVPKLIASREELDAAHPSMDVSSVDGESWLFLPLIASGRPTGCCVLRFDRPRTLGEEERTLLMALSGLVAHALERARLYDEEHSRADKLQRGLLPQTLPALPAVTPAARYVPADTGSQVGGDWYDVIPLSAERVALVVGDVMGHGLTEAVTMGRLRTAVRTLTDPEIPPDELFARLGVMVADLGDSAYATCLYAVYDPTNRSLAYASAGHPPPAVRLPDGTVRFLEMQPDPPLGAGVPPFSVNETVLPPESLLVLYTDGLVEAPGSGIEAGMDRLAARIAGRPDGPGPGEPGGVPLGVLCDSLTSGVLPPGRRTDDAAVLAVLTHGLPERDVACWELPQDPVAAGQAREHVRDQLDAWSLDHLAMTTELLVSELVANVVRHASGPARLRMIRGRTLICEVSDDSLTTPRVRHASDTDEGGRGLQLVASLSHRWGTRYTDSGKCIWTEQLRSPDLV